MTIKELLDIFQKDIITYDTGSNPESNEGDVLCRYIKHAKCKQSDFLNKLYSLVNVLSYTELDGEEKTIADWTGFINHNIKTFENFTDIWGSKLIRMPDEKGLVPLWIEQFNRFAEPISDEYFWIDFLKLIEGCEKAPQKTDGILPI